MEHNRIQVTKERMNQERLRKLQPWSAKIRNMRNCFSKAIMTIAKQREYRWEYHRKNKKARKWKKTDMQGDLWCCQE
jgi:hypothetical protein